MGECILSELNPIGTGSKPCDLSTRIRGFDCEVETSRILYLVEEPARLTISSSPIES